MQFMARKKYNKRPFPSMYDLPLIPFTKIIERYNKTHNTHYTYGQFTALLHTGKITEIGQKIDDT